MTQAATSKTKKKRGVLTGKQLRRQDSVDNLCNALLEDLAGKEIDWDMEHISAVREAAQEVIVDKLHLMTEMEFYPFIELQGKGEQ